MDDREKRLLVALVKMVRQYLDHADDGVVDSLSMSAGEHAIAVLAEYGLMEVISGRAGRWTKKSEEFWNSN
jgi:hypothetical protein